MQVSPRSKDPAKAAIQSANLVPGAGAGDGGLQRRLVHGGYARLVADEVDEQERLIFDALAEDAPIREVDGGLPAADTLTVSLLAECLAHRNRVKAHIAAYGEYWQSGKRKGDERPAVGRLVQLRREADRLADKIGMGSAARAKLGVDLARTVDEARRLTEEREAALRHGQGNYVDGD